MKHIDRLQVPSPLNPGDLIGIAAPAGPVDRERIKQGLAVIEQMGYRTVIGETVFSSIGYLAGSDQQRADNLNQWFSDLSISAIFCARGGYGSLRILPLLDYEAISRHPKVLIGFSDVTALLSAIYSRCGLVTYHGPMVSTLTMKDHRSQQALINTLGSKATNVKISGLVVEIKSEIEKMREQAQNVE